MEWCDSLWATSLRAHYARLSLSAVLETAALYDRLGRVEEADRTLRKAVAIDPLDERPRHAFMRSLAARGLVEEAVREFRTYRDLLHLELDAEPSPELRRLVANLGKRLGHDGHARPERPSQAMRTCGEMPLQKYSVFGSTGSYSPYSRL